MLNLLAWIAQAKAVRLGIAKALVAYNPDTRQYLMEGKKASCPLQYVVNRSHH